MIETFFLVLIFTIVIGIIYFRKRHKNLPPGPQGFPFLGNTTLFKPRPHILLTEMGKKYGNIFRIYLGSSLVVVLNDYEAIKEALVNQGDNFSGRPLAFLVYWFHRNRGIGNANGRVWREQRRFALHTLRDFGFGKSSLEERIMVEVQNSIDVMASHNGKRFRLSHLIDKAVCNVICSLVFDKRFDYEDKQLDGLLSKMEVWITNFATLNPINFFPPIRFVSKSFKEFVKATYEIRDFIIKLIDEHYITYQSDSPRDFIDTYITQIEEEKAINGTDTTFDRDNLIKNVENFFIGGTETTSTTIVWGILYMINYPHVQKKIQNELDQVVGPRFVSLSDRDNIPYTEAAILEILRLSNLAPLSFFRLSVKDCNLFNYFIPKGSIIIPNLWATHLDPKYWPNPTEFKPERFLDGQGKVCRKLDSFIPFSMGKRVCIGESLAKMELFLFMTNFIHRLNFTVPDGDPMPDIDNYLEGATRRPLPFDLCTTLR